MTHFWKNKKIIAFIALSHHTRFITPVMETLASRGAVVKYAVGQAERSQEITAVQQNLAYVHIFDYIGPEDHADVLHNYRLLKTTFTESLKQDFLLGVMPVTVIDKTLFAAAMEYVGIKNLLKKEKPSLCFALHERNRWGKMFAFWSKKRNIPFISMQEGLTYGKDFMFTGHAQYSTLNLVWGERDKKKLVGFEGPEAKIIPAGNTHLARELARQQEHNIRHKKRKAYKIKKEQVILLILSAQLPAPDLLMPLFKMISKADGLRIFVKFHPSCKKPQVDKWIKAAAPTAQRNLFFIHVEESTYDLFSMSDVVVLGHKSTTGLEALYFGKPVIKLDFAYIPHSQYSFVDRGVAVKMGIEELTTALSDKIDFMALMDTERIRTFLTEELADTPNAIQQFCSIFEKTVQANTASLSPIPHTPAPAPAAKDWTMVIPVPEEPDTFIAQLEAIAVNSADCGTYEILFILPEQVSETLQKTLDSLEGDIKCIQATGESNRIQALNTALENASGRMLLFFQKHLAPLKDWLLHLKNGMQTQGADLLFCARIADNRGRIAHAGMVVDHNHTPVPAYHHLDIQFAPALQQRAFQMADHFLAVERTCFFKAGGFTIDSGDYQFLDFCLKAGQLTKNPAPVIFLPALQMIFLADVPEKRSSEHAIYFFGKWHGTLWESRKKLYEKDGVSPEKLAHSTMTSAMEALR